MLNLIARVLNPKSKRGFTLIEILIVIGLIAVLAAIVIIAINPARQFAQARNTQRWSNVNAVLNAVHQNIFDNRGTFSFSGCTATSLPSIATTIASTGGADLCGCLVATYLASLPFDPTSGSYTDCTTYSSGYTIAQNANGRITIAAPSAELGQAVTVTR